MSASEEVVKYILKSEVPSADVVVTNNSGRTWTDPSVYWSKGESNYVLPSEVGSSKVVEYMTHKTLWTLSGIESVFVYKMTAESTDYYKLSVYFESPLLFGHNTWNVDISPDDTESANKDLMKELKKNSFKGDDNYYSKDFELSPFKVTGVMSSGSQCTLAITVTST